MAGACAAKVRIRAAVAGACAAVARIRADPVRVIPQETDLDQMGRGLHVPALDMHGIDTSGLVETEKVRFGHQPVEFDLPGDGPSG